MEMGRRERAEGMVQDVVDGSPGGASDIQIRDRLVRRGYDEREVLDLLDDLRFEGRLALEAGIWRRPAPGPAPSEDPGPRGY